MSNEFTKTKPVYSVGHAVHSFSGISYDNSYSLLVGTGAIGQLTLS